MTNYEFPHGSPSVIVCSDNFDASGGFGDDLIDDFLLREQGGHLSGKSSHPRSTIGKFTSTPCFRYDCFGGLQTDVQTRVECSS